jgi:hypothetical protein
MPSALAAELRKLLAAILVQDFIDTDGAPPTSTGKDAEA